MKSSVMMPHIVKFLSGFYPDNFAEIKTYSLEKKIPATEKCVAEFLGFFTKVIKPKKGLEIGCGVGYATCFLAQNIELLFAVDYNKDRLEKAKNFLKGYDNVKFFSTDIRNFLSKNNEKFDFVFVDSVKREYSEIFHILEPHLNKNAVVVFDDIFLYGMLAEKDCEIPMKYRKSVELVDEFVKDMKHKFNENIFILPIGNGLLILNYES